MYKGIGQNFSFHVEMNPFQKDKTAFTLGYTVRIFREAPFFSFISEGKEQRKVCIRQYQQFLKKMYDILKCWLLQMNLRFIQKTKIFHSRLQ